MTTLAWQRGGDPDGEAVVCLHSWGSDSSTDWDATGWVAALDAAGMGALVPDLPGHGESADVLLPDDAEPGRWTAQAILADLDRLGVQTVAAVGFADGGITAGHLAVRDPGRVTRLVLVGCDDTQGIPGGKRVGPALRDAGARLWDPEVSAAVALARGDRRHHLPTLADWAERLAWPAAPRLGTLLTPVLLAVGAADRDRRDRVSRLAALFHDARVATVPGDRRGALADPVMHAAAIRFLAVP
jgi:pimeloyl-ACP methyl ester carboxylesterase